MIRLSWLISSGLAILAVLAIQYFFQMTSESGNLGVVGVALALPFVALCSFITYKYFVRLSNQNKDYLLKSIYLIFGLLMTAALIYFSFDYKNTVYNELGGNIKNTNSKIYGMYWLNVETSRIYFNFYTICTVISVSAIAGWIRGFFHSKKQTEQE